MLEEITPESVYDKQKCDYLNRVIWDWNNSAPIVRRVLGDHALPDNSEMQAILTKDRLLTYKVSLFIYKVNHVMPLQASRTLLTLLTSAEETLGEGELRALQRARRPHKSPARIQLDPHSEIKIIKQGYKKTKRTLSKVVLSPECQDAWVAVSTSMDALLGKMPPNFDRDYLAHLMIPILSRVEKLLDAAQTARFLHSDTEVLNESVRAADSLLVSAANSLTPLVMEATEIMRIVVEADSIMSDREMGF